MLKDCKTPSPESFPQYPCEVGVWWGKPEAQRGFSALLSLHEEPEAQPDEGPGVPAQLSEHDSPASQKAHLSYTTNTAEEGFLFKHFN